MWTAKFRSRWCGVAQHNVPSAAHSVQHGTFHAAQCVQRTTVQLFSSQRSGFHGAAGVARSEVYTHRTAALSTHGSAVQTAQFAQRSAVCAAQSMQGSTLNAARQDVASSFLPTLPLSNFDPCFFSGRRGGGAGALILFFVDSPYFAFRGRVQISRLKFQFFPPICPPGNSNGPRPSGCVPPHLSAPPHSWVPLPSSPWGFRFGPTLQAPLPPKPPFSLVSTLSGRSFHGTFSGLHSDWPLPQICEQKFGVLVRTNLGIGANQNRKQ